MDQRGLWKRALITVFIMLFQAAKIYSFRNVLVRVAAPTAFDPSRNWRLTKRATSSSETPDDSQSLPPMANLYQEWSLDQDQILWQNKDKAPAELAALLGRGIRGVEARMSKLSDVSSSAYGRLFGDGTATTTAQKEKLVPAGEVLRRIEWDYMLQASDFYFLHYDRVDDSIVESPVDAPNNSISGKETMFAKALPEHRIVGIKYKERLVWDRANRMDLVFSEPGIYEIIENYEEWKHEKQQVEAWNQQRQKQVADRIRSILGLEYYTKLQELSSDLLNTYNDETISTKSQVEDYVQQSLNLFRLTRNDPSRSLDPSLVPMSDYLALDALSELVAVLPEAELRSLLLAEIATGMTKAEGKGPKASPATAAELIELNEEDLTETFVRGSGPGGQKINKTSNRVLLVHEPTQLKVECQDTRSLQQNRKIARKRLKEKLDEYLNGSQSKNSLKQQKAAVKRQKSKSKNRARQRKKQQEKELQSNSYTETDDSNQY